MLELLHRPHQLVVLVLVLVQVRVRVLVLVLVRGLTRLMLLSQWKA